MKTESFVSILILLCIIASGCLSIQTLESDKNKIMTSFTEHQSSIKDYSGTVSLTYDNENHISEYYKIQVRYPDKYKVEYLESSGRNPGTILIANAGTFVEFDPVHKATTTAEINPNGNEATSRDYQGLLNRLIPLGNTSFAGVDYLEKHPAYLIEIRPKRPGDDFNLKFSEFRFSRVKAWVDAGSWLVKRIELYDSDGTRRIVSADYQDLSINSGISDTVFGTERYMQYSNFTAPIHPPIVKYPGVEYPQ
ncbi:MAG: hypothetical protein WC586_11845 [Methanoregula sp.]